MQAELAEENGKLQDELRAVCAELHEAKIMLDFIKTQRDPEQLPQCWTGCNDDPSASCFSNSLPIPAREEL